MNYVVRTDRNNVPRVFEIFYGGFLSVSDAATAYITEQKLKRQDLFSQINTRMSRLASCERKIRMAGKLGEKI